MENEAARAQLQFHKAAITGIVTTVGGQCINFAEEGEKYGLDENEISRLQRAIGLDRRQVVAGSETTVDLCEASAKRLLAGLGVDPHSVSALIMVTQSPDYAAPSSATTLQNRLGLPITSMAFDMRLGCSGFIYGLSVAFSLVEAGLEKVLLCVGDVSSRFVDTNDHSIAPIMGDAGAAILIERRESKSFFQLYSDGSGDRALMIPNSGLRHLPQDDGKPAFMTMDGAAVFNFTLQRVPGMVDDILKYAGVSSDDVDYFVLHQPNKYILKNIQKRLKISEEKLPMSTQSMYGNQNSASIPGTISGFLASEYQDKKMTSLFAGFGIGLSWGACVLETNKIFAPSPFYYSGKQ
ncbi:ketoacyl-ACP synthase III [Undibacterium sp. Ji67W]|uniref:ketoacyl-ACP synthase III n=1 Tax=Undibacterium sp. Ji67W TaxID=3413042 RepID=UPI003BF0837D